MPVTGNVTVSPNSVGVDVEWSIPNFFSLSEKNGGSYRSSEFLFAGATWWFLICPYGYECDGTFGYIDLYIISYTSRDLPLSMLEFSVSLKTVSGQKKYKVIEQGKLPVFRRFVSRSELSTRHSKLVPHGALTLFWSIKKITAPALCNKICQLEVELLAVSQELQAAKKELKERVSELQSTKQDNLRFVQALSAANDNKQEKYKKEILQKEQERNFAVTTAIIVMVLLTGCILAYSKTSLSSLRPYEEQLSRPVLIVTDVSSTYLEVVWNLPGESKINIARYILNFRKSGDKWQEVSFPDLSQNSYTLTNLEPGVPHEIFISVVDVSGFSNCSETAIVRTFEKNTEAVTKIHASEMNKAIDRSVVVGSNESVTSDSNEIGVTDITEAGVSKTLAAGVNKADHLGIAGSEVSEASPSSQIDDAETNESELLPQPVLIVTVIGPTYIELVWVLPEESELNTVPAYYILHFRKLGAEWQEIPISDPSQNFYSLTNLDPGMYYQIYVIAVDFSGFSRSSETATVRTSIDVIYHEPPKSHTKQPAVSTVSIIVIFFASACVYAYRKTLYGETKAISTEDVNTIKDDQPKDVETDECEFSDSGETSDTETEEPVSVANLPEDYGFVNDINHLLKEGKGIDVTFELETQRGKTKFCAHQLIMSVMSSYFAEQFYSKRKNKEHLVIPLNGMNLKAFEQTIRFCYGEKPSLKTAAEACVLLEVASKFKVMSLRNLCRTFLRQTKIEHRSVFGILKILDKIEDSSLVDMCYKILQHKTREVMATYELCDVTPAMVHTILDLSKLSLNCEYELINWIFKWGKVKYKDIDSPSENAREYLATLLQKMNFLSLTFEEFATLCKDNTEFFSLNEMVSIYQNIACAGTREMPAWYGKDLKCRVYSEWKK